MKILLEDVFKTSGIPTYTFVEPQEYLKIKVAIRTKGRGVIIEGPSGIGKTTCVLKAIEELKLNQNILVLTARKKEDRELIKELPQMGEIGTVIIDDFHTLDDSTKIVIADYLKTLADEETIGSKVIIIGINKAGNSLIKFAPDLNNRIDTIKFEKNSDEKIVELITKGEETLKISIQPKAEIVKNANGSFHITQLLCHEYCLLSKITDEQEKVVSLTTSIELVKEKVLEELGRVFYHPAKEFAIGTKLRREGRAPYLHLLNWLAYSNDWSIQLDDIILQHPEFKGSIGQVIDKDYLKNLIETKEEVSRILHYDSTSRILTVEDPKFLFYIRNLLWNKFAEEIGYINTSFETKYDFALSFAGENRDLAEKIFERLLENEVEVFYDKHEQFRILAENVEDYLAPIYRSEAAFIVVLLSKYYPQKIWAKFESEQFKHRFGDNSVIPIWYSDVDFSLFDETKKVGGITFNIDSDIDEQVKSIVDLLLKKLEEKRIKSSSH